MVTGPALTRSTFITEPNRPVATAKPRSRSRSAKRVTSGSATRGGAARRKLGRRPPVKQSAWVNDRGHARARGKLGTIGESEKCVRSQHRATRPGSRLAYRKVD